MVVAWIIESIVSRKRDGGNFPGALKTGQKTRQGIHFLRISTPPAWQWSCFHGKQGDDAMRGLRTVVVFVVAGLLLGLPAMVAAQRPSEGVGGGGGGGAAASRGGDAGSSSGASGGVSSPGASGPIAGPGGYSTATGGAASPGGGSNWVGATSAGSTGWGGSNAIRPRDEVFQRPGFSDVYSNRGISRNNAVPATGSETPWYSRPRGEVPASGTAMLRTDYIASRPPGGGGGGNPGWGNGGGYPEYPWYYPGYGPGYGYWGGYYGWYMYPWTWNSYGYGYPDCGWGGFGMGYFYYNPFGWNYYGNCGYYGSGFYGSSAYGYGAADAMYGAGGASVGYGQYQSRGGLRLKVKPSDARVYVDGYFAGKVEQFDGQFQKLDIEKGKHKIEISAAGYAPMVIEVDITPGQVMTWEGNLEKIK